MTESHRRHAFAGVSALLFAASAAVTVVWCRAMSGMGELPMPGGWSLSNAWTPMCGQTWAGAATSFIGMWAVMMVAMMLPSLAPRLWRERHAPGAHGVAQRGGLTALAGAGYFAVWAVLGAVVFALGAALSQAVLQLPALARAVPVSAGVVALLAGAFQFTACKAHHLACCRPAAARGGPWPASATAAWRHGLRLGLHCSQACAGLTVLLLVMGVMDLRAMAVVAAAITAERLLPAGQRVAHAVGMVSVGAGGWLTASALGLA